MRGNVKGYTRSTRSRVAATSAGRTSRPDRAAGASGPPPDLPDPMRVVTFLSRRLLLVALVMAVVSVLIFAVVQILPGDVAAMILGTSSTPEDLAAPPGQARAEPPGPAPLSRLDRRRRSRRLGRLAPLQDAGPPARARAAWAIRGAGRAGACGWACRSPSGSVSSRRSAGRELIDQPIGLVSLVAVSLPEFIMGTALILVLAFCWPVLPPSSMIDPQARLWRRRAEPRPAGAHAGPRAPGAHDADDAGQHARRCSSSRTSGRRGSGASGHAG